LDLKGVIGCRSPFFFGHEMYLFFSPLRDSRCERGLTTMRSLGTVSFFFLCSGAYSQTIFLFPKSYFLVDSGAGFVPFEYIPPTSQLYGSDRVLGPRPLPDLESRLTLTHPTLPRLESPFLFPKLSHSFPRSTFNRLPFFFLLGRKTQVVASPNLRSGAVPLGSF